MAVVYAILVAGVINLIMGVILILGSEEKRKSLPLAFFSFATFLVGLSDFFIYKLQIPIFDRLSYASGIFIAVFLITWIYNYVSKNAKAWISWLIYAIGFVFSMLILFSDLFIFDIQKSSTIGLQEQQGILSPLYIASFLIAYAAVLIGLMRVLRTGDEMVKKQARVILTGFSIYGASAILFGLILPFLGFDTFTDFDIIVSVIFVGFTTYAIVQYKWMNIKVIAVQFLSLLIVSMALMEIFLAETVNQRIYKGVVFVVITAIVVMLVRSVMAEVRRKEQLQTMADKLAQANDALRKLDNAKTEFLSIASHQLRTPLTAIKGFVSLLLEGSYGELKPEQKGALEKVYSSGDRLIQLVEDLLNVSRIESGRMQFAIEKGDMKKLLKELYENFLLIAKTKKFYLELKIPEDGLPEVYFDYSKVRELVSNFVDNALKYTEKGGVTVSAERLPQGVVVDENGFVIAGQDAGFGEVVRVTVSDTGIGVPQEEIPYLFKKFSRGKDVSRLHVGGTGLGLYVGKAIADAHHGAVWVESDGANLGSRFIIELPINQ